MRRLFSAAMLGLLLSSCAAARDGSGLAPQRAAAIPAEPSRSAPFDRERLDAMVFPDDPTATESCAAQGEKQTYVDCLLRLRFAGDEDARELAHRLYTQTGIVTGVEPRRVMNDSGYRGRVEIEPALPTGADRQHLRWLLDAFDELSAMMRELQARAPSPLQFIAKPLAIRFYRTTNTTTPSAYVADGTIAYNVRGELMTSYESVFETLVHELFHLYDADHEDWSERVLGTMYDRIRRRCRGGNACLARFAPHETRVNGGTYYAFHHSSDVREYAAELAIRYVREHRHWLLDVEAPPKTPRFKCLTSENRVAWRAMSEELFGGLDLVPHCKSTTAP